MHRILLSVISLFFFLCLEVSAQDTLLPLSRNYIQLENYRAMKGMKSSKPDTIHVDLSTSKILILDDFNGRISHLRAEYWKDNSVYPNRSFAYNPVSLGIATFDGLDERGYPYEFTINTSYGSCDSLTTLPIELGKVNADAPDFDTVYLSFIYQPQGINPFPNSTKDSLALFFKDLNILLKIDSIPEYDSVGNLLGYIIETNYLDLSTWDLVWSAKGSAAYDFRQAIVQVNPAIYKNGFQFRFISYGNQSGGVDHWNIDNVYLSAEPRSKHESGEDFAFRTITGSNIQLNAPLDTFHYTAIPWFHYYKNPVGLVSDKRLNLNISSSCNLPSSVDIKYEVYNAFGLKKDGINKSPSGTPIPAQANKSETMPLTGDPEHDFIYPTDGIQENTTTYFRREMIMEERLTSCNDLFKENNSIIEYQVFGTYYAYDDGSAEAGWGVKGDGGKVALRFKMPDGLVDTLTSVYMYFLPVVEDRSIERFRLTVWNDNNGRPGSIIYENSTVYSPIYPMQGVNAYQRIFLDEPFVLGDVNASNGTFYIGWQKLSAEVINIGYDVNNPSNDKLFFDIGSGWIKSETGGSVLVKGSIMFRPSFRHLTEPEVGIVQQRSIQKLDINIYPNPASSMVHLRMADEHSGNMTGEIYGIDGSLIRTFQFTRQTELDVSELRPGIYIVRCVESAFNSVTNSKLVISR